MPLNTLRRVPALTVLVVTVLLGGPLTGCSGTDDPARPVRTAAAPRGLLGPPLTPRVLLGALGPVTCPTGAEPTIDLERAEFRPGLVGGTRLSNGMHRITLTGSVTNETNSPVHVLGVTMRVGGRRWRAAVSGPTRLGPGAAGAILVRGTYRSRRTQQARVGAALHWRWTDPDLRPCGHRGLLDDD